MVTHNDEQMRVHQMLLPKLVNYAEVAPRAAHAPLEFRKESRCGDSKKIIPRLRDPKSDKKPILDAFTNIRNLVPRAGHGRGEARNPLPDSAPVSAPFETQKDMRRVTPFVIVKNIPL